MSIRELRYLRKAFISVLATLLHGARSLWLLRCTEAFQPANGFTSMSTTRLSPSHSTQLSISFFMSSPASPGPWLSSFESDALDEDEVLIPKVSVANMMDAGGEVLVYLLLLMTLSHFVSVADLQRTPGASSIDFSIFCFETPVGGTGYKASCATRWPTPSPPSLPTPPLASCRPIMDSRVNMGYSADLAMETDVN
jgi:hypothetical protein